MHDIPGAPRRYSEAFPSEYELELLSLDGSESENEDELFVCNRVGKTKITDEMRESSFKPTLSAGVNQQSRTLFCTNISQRIHLMIGWF